VVKGEFECRVTVERGENRVTVAAAGDRDLESAGTTVRQFDL